eukprot:CAMPEP_0180175122 /NCGR_PEP_ID=MMETSP0986-20121125/36546_1 /TAXON_ID=697907 /ORGANISM="non described non described, Strain CCMP2293" /LENGTH=64 /DNA_ID=CAMNT_0022127567 /DNA_START=73 /DNA_END=263 /DNA_ORIENTATION=-
MCGPRGAPEHAETAAFWAGLPSGSSTSDLTDADEPWSQLEAPGPENGFAPPLEGFCERVDEFLA